MISLNLERYRLAKRAKLKSKVIDSIVDQLTYADCRFVKKANAIDQKEKSKEIVDNAPPEYWEVMNHKESRTKVAHALRDKRESNDHEPAFARLKSRTEALDTESKIGSDLLYIAANAMILTVELTGRESETLIKALLCDAIDSVGEHTSTACNQDNGSYASLHRSNQEMTIEVTTSSNINSGGSQQKPFSAAIYCDDDSKDTISHDSNSSCSFQKQMVGTLPMPSQVTSLNLEHNSQYQNNRFAIPWNPQHIADSRDYH